MPSASRLELPELQRVNYFAGQLLTTDDFVAEQTYHRERSRLHNRLLHGWGVVAGLDARSRAGVIVISPGMAFDPSGDEIVLHQETTLTPATGAKGGPSLYVVVKYAESPAHPTTNPVFPADESAQSRIVLGASFELTTAVPRTAGSGVAIARLLWRTSQWRVDARYRRRRVS